jgi:hypothetical protein
MALFVHAVMMTVVSLIGGVGSWSVAPLFGEADAGGIALLGAVFGAIGYSVKWLVEKWAEKRKAESDEEEKRHVREAKAKDDEIEHWKRLVVRYEDEHRRLVRVERQAARAVAWIRAQEMLLRHQKIHFVRYDPDDDDDSDDSVVVPHGPDPSPKLPDPPAGGGK